MITEKDLQAAIAECHGERNPNANTCLKLAAYYTIKDHLASPQSYSFAAERKEPMRERRIENVVDDYGESEFYEAIAGTDSKRAWEIINDLMDALSILNPKLYDSVIRKFG